MLALLGRTHATMLIFGRQMLCVLTILRPASCVVPVHVQHQSLALYLFQRLYACIAGLGLAVAAALQPKTHREGHGHYDVFLKHAGSLFKGPFQCHGFKSTELKVRQVVRNVKPSTAG